MKNKMPIMLTLLVAFIFAAFHLHGEGHAIIHSAIAGCSYCIMMPSGLQRMHGSSNNIIARPTQLQKALHTAAKFGGNADSAQFTERAIYDTLPLDGRTTFRFFENCSARSFPRTNLSENKLQKQENMIIKYFSLEVLTFTVAGNNIVSAINPLSAAFGGQYRSDMSIQIAQNVVLKPFPIDRLNPAFNTYARHTTHNVMRLGVDLTIPELLEFVAQIQTTTYTAVTTAELMLTLHGQATIFSPRASF